LRFWDQCRTYYSLALQAWVDKRKITEVHGCNTVDTSGDVTMQNLYRALTYALSCVKQELLVRRINRWRLSSSCLKGRTLSCGSLPAMESPYATSYCPSYLTSSWVGPTLPSLTEMLFLLFLPLCLMVHEYYFPRHLSIFSLNLQLFYGMFFCWNYDCNQHAHIQSIPGRSIHPLLY